MKGTPRECDITRLVQKSNQYDSPFEKFCKEIIMINSMRLIPPNYLPLRELQ